MEPVYAKGNVFFRGNDRFLIKGISYFPRAPRDPTASHYTQDSVIDALTDDRIPDLERDIPILKQLGLKTIQVTALDPTKSHHKAMTLLAEAGIYVLAEVCNKMKAPERNADPNFDPSRYYTLSLMRRAFRIVDQLSDHSNLLGFTVDAKVIRSRSVTKMAEVCRAAVRDIKTLLRLRQGRVQPVGVHVSDIMDLRTPMLQYFAAGPISERADYFAHDCYSWASPSDFRISGWSNMVQAFTPYPVPTFLAAYGTNINERTWGEVECLYSPDMTGVFSGGCIYTYFEYGNWYGIVTVKEDGEVEFKQPEFWRLKEKFGVVNARAVKEVHGKEVKGYEGWTGTFPAVQGGWHAGANLPDLPATVEAMFEEIEKEKAEFRAEEACERMRGMHLATDAASQRVAEEHFDDDEIQRQQESARQTLLDLAAQRDVDHKSAE
ncbi:1,3-beta-glucanosyltransferase [Extremus antarcticus]|uniref:1,3-beta-glucanosyltransferase n=1 Tax=Extremus antarcticus TaxID=702011 RepID=A0AAJ0DC34_9PEZI|nr:1,3-beta-glucanosyltransferase [Extremus antarcticus]